MTADVSDVVFAIDPGPEQSAYVRYEVTSRRLLAAAKMENDRVPIDVAAHQGDTLTIENIRGYGMRVGQEVFDTCIWIGRFVERYERYSSSLVQLRAVLIDRPTVKLYVCGNRQARDADVRAALIDRWGGKEAARGNKKKPGPLYGISGDVWASLAVAVAWDLKRKEDQAA